jgi:glycosyltransferase involved in cell wall biosynthesis
MEPLISLCMIVKDEEQCLARCLDSVKNIVDEIIIVDTGSTDNTVKIAEFYTEHVYHFEWINDFAAARNESIKHATGKWILVLDADEYLEPEAGQTLREFFQKEEPDVHIIYAMNVLNFLGKGGSTGVSEALVNRVFPNHLGIRYHRPIHEQPRSRDGAKLQYKAAPCRILHSGYKEETLVAKRKHERNLSIFEQHKVRNGGYSAYDYLMLGNQYIMMGDYDQASIYLHKALGKEKELGTAYKQVLFSLLSMYLNTKQFIEAWGFMDKHLTSYEKYPDILAIRGSLYFNLGFYEEAKIIFQRCLSVGEELARSGEAYCIVSHDLAAKLPLRILTNLFEREKDFRQTIYYLTKLLGAFKDGAALTQLIRILSLNDPVPSIISFLDRLLDHKDPLIIPLLCKISISLGHTELSRHYTRLLSSPQLLHLADQLRYSLMLHDQAGFQRIWTESKEEDKINPQSIYHLVLAAVSWNHPSWLEWVHNPPETDSKAFINWGQELLAVGMKDASVDDQSHAFSLLSGLYTISHLERFDQILDSVNSTHVLNKIANLLYTLHHDDAAMQCYTYLHEHGTLNHYSCMNLADTYLYTGDTETALQYLEQAIYLNPQDMKLYVHYCAHCTDPVRRNQMKQRLLQLDPHYKNLPPFMAL